MYVVGFSKRMRWPAIVISAVSPLQLALAARTLPPCSRASTSTNQKPALWRVASYSAPGLPRPTIKSIGVPISGSASHNGKAASGRPFGLHGGSSRAGLAFDVCPSFGRLGFASSLSSPSAVLRLRRAGSACAIAGTSPAGSLGRRPACRLPRRAADSRRRPDGRDRPRARRA